MNTFLKTLSSLLATAVVSIALATGAGAQDQKAGTKGAATSGDWENPGVTTEAIKPTPVQLPYPPYQYVEPRTCKGGDVSKCRDCYEQCKGNQCVPRTPGMKSCPDRSCIPAGEVCPSEQCGATTCQRCTETCVNGACQRSGMLECEGGGEGECVLPHPGNPANAACGCTSLCPPCTHKCEHGRCVVNTLNKRCPNNGICVGAGEDCVNKCNPPCNPCTQICSLNDVNGQRGVWSCSNFPTPRRLCAGQNCVPPTASCPEDSTSPCQMSCQPCGFCDATTRECKPGVLPGGIPLRPCYSNTQPTTYTCVSVEQECPRAGAVVSSY